jgi:large subunit ribosomal protein L29
VKISEIREHSEDQLRIELEALERRQFDLRTQGVTEKVQATSQIRQARRDVARILTVMREREQAAQAEAVQAEEKGQQA